jgi:hypothetical protein
MFFLLLAFAPVVRAEPLSYEVFKLLPDKIGEFHQLPSMRPLLTLAKEGILTPSAFRVPTNKGDAAFIGGEVDYLSSGGEKLSIEILKLQGESDAFSLLTLVANKMRQTEPANISLEGVGSASIVSSRQVVFVSGALFLRVTDTNPKSSSSETALTLARLLVDQFDKGEGQIPVLVKHLPAWQSVQSQVLYAVNRDTLKNAFSNQPVLDAVSFDGGAEAVVADYGTPKLVIVEFNTASLATDNDQRIKAKLEELRNQGQPTPTAYRRVGNYAVFVFDAPSEQAANQLIDQVKYQQVVQWLGEDPFVYERATREFTETTLGVFVAVVKASGLALVSCLVVGGFFGALLFSLRRAQQRAKEAYSDSDAMLRLNLDELTPESDPARLLGRGH